MNIRRICIRLGLMGLLLPFTGLLWAGTAFAGSIQISPASVDYTIKPGESVTYELQVKNDGKEPLGIATSTADYYYDVHGDKVFVEGGVTGEEKFSLKTWITTEIPKDLVLAPGEYKRMKVTITVPEDAEPGGHYGVLFFTMKNPEVENTAGGASVGVSGRIGAIILVDVPGFIVKSAKIERFKVGNRLGNPGEEQFYEQTSFETGPIDFDIGFHNLGTTHYYPEGTITVTGGITGDKWQFDVQPKSREEKARALPRVTKDIYTELAQRKLFGKYTATLQMSDGDNNPLPPVTLEFWVVPIKTVLLWTLLLIVGITLLTVLVKRYNHWIASRARAA